MQVLQHLGTLDRARRWCRGRRLSTKEITKRLSLMTWTRRELHGDCRSSLDEEGRESKKGEDRLFMLKILF
jgi:hypothetical protein